jgi:dipeptidase E
MKLLLTSSGVCNSSIYKALTDLLGKPITESSALFIPTAIYPFPGGSIMAWNAVSGKSKAPLAELGWKSLGILELTALPGIDRNSWIPNLEETDALLVWGGDPVYLAYWMRQSGLGAVLSNLRKEIVYVGVSAGSMATAPILAETYRKPYCGTGPTLSLEEMIFGEDKVSMNFVTAEGAGLIDFAIIPHANDKSRPDASFENAAKWAAKLPVPLYAIDDETAIKITGNTIEVISEGEWKLIS